MIFWMILAIGTPSLIGLVAGMLGMDDTGPLMTNVSVAMAAFVLREMMS